MLKGSRRDDDSIIVDSKEESEFEASILVIDALAREELIKIDSRSLW